MLDKVVQYFLHSGVCTELQTSCKQVVDHLSRSFGARSVHILQHLGSNMLVGSMKFVSLGR